MITLHVSSCLLWCNFLCLNFNETPFCGTVYITNGGMLYSPNTENSSDHFKAFVHCANLLS